jgi:catechol 2,3-dioxygenase-like lactoylglutathione lyase family enzyme
VTEGRPETLSAVTIGVTDMAASCAFYDALGFQAAYGGPDAAFTSYAVGATFLNLQLVPRTATGWGRFIVHVDDVDAIHARAVAAGLSPTMAPADAPWGERYFHIDDPDGHELSLARPLR